MSTIKRRSRKLRADTGTIENAWTNGLEPPPAAFEEENRDQVIGAVFFDWAEQKANWSGKHHPYQSAWLDALRATRG